jgi:alpha-galactosidase/6-phospho-beta-glucosidase family protein
VSPSNGSQVTTKITLVGGSLVWGTAPLTDTALNTPLHGATIAMQGIDKTALDLMARTGRKISERALASFWFESATGLAEAGARLVRRSRKADNR